MTPTLATRIAKWAKSPGDTLTPLSGLKFFRQEGPGELTRYLQEPSICLVAQGAKRIIFGEGTYEYGEGRLVLTTIDLPLLAQVTQASPHKNSQK